MKKLLVFAAMVSALVVTTASQADVVTNIKTPVGPLGFNPCNGEFIVGVTGELHTLISANVNGNNVSGQAHFQDVGISGTGAVTGALYHRNGTTQFKFKGSLQNDQFETTTNNSFQWIAQGSVPNFRQKDIIHLTIDANGNATATVANSTTSCN